MTPLNLDRSFKPTHEPYAANRTHGTTAIPAGVSALSYNNFNFPPAVRSHAHVEAVYDTSGRSLKAIRIKLHIEFFLFHGLNLGAAGTPWGTIQPDHLYSGNYDRDANTPNDYLGASFTTDREMDNARLRLLEPCQPLYFVTQGLGTVKIAVDDELGNFPPSQGWVPDLENGPKPEVVEWSPRSNKMAFVVWECSTTIPPCGAIELSNLLSVPGSSSPSQFAVTEFNYSVNFHIDHSGNTVRTISGIVALASSRLPLVTGNPASAHASSTADSNMLSEYQNIRGALMNFFVLMPGFLREQDYTISENRQSLTFTIVDTEIETDEPYGPGIVDANVSVTASNAIDFAFNRYDVTMSGSLTVAAGLSKLYAFDEITRLFNKFYTTAGKLGSQVIRRGAAPPNTRQGHNDDGTLSLEANASIPQLRSFSVTDQVFGRTVDFTISWWLTTTLATLFKATGMFVPVTPPNDQTNRWSLWRTTLAPILDFGGLQNLPISAANDIIMSICNPFTQISAEPFERTVPPQSEAPANEPDNITPDDTWIDYQARFEVERIDHAAIHYPLGSYSGDPEPSRGADVMRAHTAGLSAFTPTSPDPNQYGFSHYQREATYILHFYGAAIRINYAVPEPAIVQYGNAAIARFGRTILKPRFLGHVIDMVSGQQRSVFGLLWHKMYALQAPPANSKIVGDGHSDIFA